MDHEIDATLARAEALRQSILKRAFSGEVCGSAATVPFDDRCHPHASLGDLSRLLIREHLQDAGNELQHIATRVPMDVLGRLMNIVGGATGARLPKNAGLLFFNDRPHEFLAGTQINVVCFPDGADGRIEEEEFRGPLAAILRNAMSYIEGGFLRVRVVKYPHRPEADRFWNYPPTAIEETLGNAIFHRSYEEREPVEVRITPNEILVQSYPGPHCAIRMDDLQRGRAASCCYRNPRIGEFLKELNLARCGATGVPRILRAMHNNGSPPPSFETDDDLTWFRVRLPVHSEFLAAEEERHTEQDALQDNQLKKNNKESSTEQDTEQVAEQDAEQVTEQAERVVVALTGEMRRDQLQDIVGISHRPHFLETYLKPALQAGLIEMTLPDKPTSRRQRYRRTSVGEALARELIGASK